MNIINHWNPALWAQSCYCPKGTSLSLRAGYCRTWKRRGDKDFFWKDIEPAFFRCGIFLNSMPLFIWLVKPMI